ncbi:MAG: ABC transporter permease [Eubacteriales bacterium]|nr:ABC transporter permease [Eubacteriales bacterium]
MKVFSLYFKILRSNKAGILSYLMSFLLVFFLISSSVKQDLPSSRLDLVKPKIQVNDHDQTALSQHLKAYLLKDAQTPETELPEDKEIIKQALYSGGLDYMLVIPKGFTDSLAEEGKYLDLITYPSSLEGVATSIEMKIVSYVQNWDRIAKTFGGQPQWADMARALGLLDEVLAADVEIYTHTGQMSEGENDQLIGLAYYLSYLSYIMTAVGFLIVGRAIVSLENPLTRRRDIVSGFSEGRRTVQLFAASYLSVSLVWLLMVAVCFFMVGWNVLSLEATPRMVFSSFLHMLAMVSLTLFLCHLFPTDSAVTFMSNLVSLFLAFSSGTFIPAEFLWEPFHKMSSLFPTFWDVQNQTQVLHNLLAENQLTSYYQSLAIMVGMGLVYFFLTLIHRHFKSAQVSI